MRSIKITLIFAINVNCPPCFRLTFDILPKAKQLAAVKNLFAVHTISSVKLVNKLDSYGGSIGCFVQINVSGEETKSGISCNDISSIKTVVQSVMESKNLRLQGLMTIGLPKKENSNDHIQGFKNLVTVRDKLELPDLQLSMGMSSDFVEAIEHGADYVRVGSKLFGARDYSKAN